MASAEPGSKKRKRDDDKPRITYYAEGRTFERLFKEESLSDTLDVVRRKLGLGDNARIVLSQTRGDQIIDLEDDDDFEAFHSLAYNNMSMSVRVQVREPLTAPNISAQVPVQTTRPSAVVDPPLLPPLALMVDNITNVQETSLSPSGANENPRDTQTSSKQLLPVTDSEPPPTKRPKLQTAGAIVNAYQAGEISPAAVQSTLAPSVVAETPPVANESTSPPVPMASVETLPQGTNAADVSSMPPRRRWRATLVESGRLDQSEVADRASPHPAEMLPSATAMLGDHSRSVDAETPTAPAETTSPPKSTSPPAPPPTVAKRSKKKKTAETPTADAGVNALPTASAVTSEPKAKKSKASRKSAPVAEEPLNLAISPGIQSRSVHEVPIIPAVDIPAEPPKKAKKSKKSKATESAIDPASSTTEMSIQQHTEADDDAGSEVNGAAASHPGVRIKPQTEPKFTSSTIANSQGDTQEARVVLDSGSFKSVNNDAKLPATAALTTKPRKARVKEKIGQSEANEATPHGPPFQPSLDKFKCPVCQKAPFHLRFRCPVVKAGAEAIETRLRELREQGEYPNVVRELEAIAEKLKSPAGNAAKAANAGSKSFVSETVTNTTKPSSKAQNRSSSKPYALANDVVESSAGSSNKPNSNKPRKPTPRVPIPNEDFLMNFGTAPPIMDLSSIDPEALLRGPESLRMTIDDIESASESDENPSKDDILEEEEDKDVPSARQRLKRASDSSSDEQDTGMDVDSPESDLVDVPLATVDRLGQSQDMDRSPDDALSSLSHSGSIDPNILATAGGTWVGPECPTGSQVAGPLQTPPTTQAESRRSIMDSGAASSSPSASLGGTLNGGQVESLPDAPPKRPLPSSQSRLRRCPDLTHNSNDAHGKSIPPCEMSGVINSDTARAMLLHSTHAPETSAAGRNGKESTTTSTARPKRSNQANATAKRKGTQAKKKKTTTNGNKHAPAREAVFPSSPFAAAEQSLVQWETLPTSESPGPDQSSQGLDELDGHDSEAVATSTPLPLTTPKLPLFLPTDSQFPTFSQTQSTQPNVRSPAESDDEAEVEGVVKRNHSRQSSSATAYRRLTDIASQPLFSSPTIVQPPRFSNKKQLADKAALYGLPPRVDEGESSTSSDGSDSEEAANRSHIPLVRRAGFTKAK